MKSSICHNLAEDTGSLLPFIKETDGKIRCDVMNLFGQGKHTLFVTLPSDDAAADSFIAHLRKQVEPVSSMLNAVIVLDKQQAYLQQRYSDFKTVVDETGSISIRFQLNKESLLLVRPDFIIEKRAVTADIDGVFRYFQSVYTLQGDETTETDFPYLNRLAG
jgi:hypothetical protein